MPRRPRLNVDTIFTTPEFKWVRYAAERKDTGRPILTTVLVERQRLVAADGFRLRVWAVPVDVKKPQLRSASDGSPFQSSTPFPAYGRLWDEAQVRWGVIIDADILRTLVKELADFERGIAKPLDRRARGTLMPVVKFTTKSGRLYLLREVRNLPLKEASDPAVVSLPRVYLAPCRGVRIDVAVNVHYMVDAAKDLDGQVDIAICSGGHPIRISDQPDRYELIMPMFVGGELSARPLRSYQQVAAAAIKKHVGVTPGRLRAMVRGVDQLSSRGAYALATSLALHADGSRILGRAQRLSKRMDKWFKEERERDS